MSTSSDAMAAMLARQLMQPQQQSSYGGGIAGPQMQARATPLSTGADIVQKLMLMRALQQQPRPAGTPLQPDPNMMGGVNAIPQAMNQQPIPGGVNS